MVKEISSLNGINKNEIKTRTSRIWLDEEGIVRIVKLLGVEETLEDAERNIAAVIKVSGDKKRPIFIDGSLLKSITRKARMYYAKNIPKLARAIAPLIKSTFSRVLVSFLTGYIKRVENANVPIKSFKTEKLALDWLKEYLD